MLERSCVVSEVLVARHSDQLLQLVHSDLTVGLVVKCIAEALSLLLARDLLFLPRRVNSKHRRSVLEFPI